MTLAPHYHWKMPSRLKGKDTWVTREKLTEAQALLINPDAWPINRSLEMRPVVVSPLEVESARRGLGGEVRAEG